MELFINVLVLSAWVCFVIGMLKLISAIKNRNYHGSLKEKLDYFTYGKVMDVPGTAKEGFLFLIPSLIFIGAYYLM